MFLNLQQRRLFRIFTGFPFNHATCANLVGRKTSNILLLIITGTHHTQPIMKRDDSLWKSILEDIFEDLLLFFFPHVSNVFDFSRNFEYLDKELDQLFPPEANSSGIRFVDKLVKVHCKNGDNQWILVHIEVQGYHDASFSQRMFTYYSRILDKYNKPVTAFAIFTDRNSKFRPNQYRRKFLGTSVCYRFNTFKIMDQDEGILKHSDNPFAIVALTVKTALKGNNIIENELLKLKIELTKSLLSKRFSKAKIRKLLIFLRHYICFENPENDAKFEYKLDEITQTSKTMGIEEFILDRTKKEGIAEGESKKTAEITMTLLSQTNFSIEEIARLVGVEPDFVRKIKREKL